MILAARFTFIVKRSLKKTCITVETDHHWTCFKICARDERTATENVRWWCLSSRKKLSKTSLYVRGLIQLHKPPVNFKRKNNIIFHANIRTLGSLRADEIKLMLTPSAKQRRNPFSGLPAVYPDLSTRYDWPVKKGLCFVCRDRPSGWREIRNALPVIRWVRWGFRTRISALLRRRH